MEEIKFFILGAGYDVNDKVKVRITGRKDGEKIRLVDESFIPYFYAVPESDPEEVSERIRNLEVEGDEVVNTELVELKVDKKRKKVIKVFVKNPPLVPKFRKQVRKVKGVLETREDDIPFIRRYFIDHDLRPLGEAVAEVEGDKILSIKPGEEDLEPKILAFDIETYAKDGFSLAEKNPIIMISVSGCGISKVLSYRHPVPEFAELLAGEKEMIERFMHLVQKIDPDILVGYNSDDFDFPYLRKRCEKLGIKLTFGKDEVLFVRRGRSSAAKTSDLITMDVYTFVRNVVSRSLKADSLDLDTVANELLGVGKTDLSCKDMLEAWDSGDLQPLYKYSKRDADLTLALAEKLFPLLFELSRLSSIPLFDVCRMSTGQIVEWFLISRANQEGILVPNRPRRSEQMSRRGRSFTGGFVREPDKGLHKNIAVMDFRSLYPTIMVEHNVGNDTLNCECCRDNMAPSGDWFCLNKKAFLPSVLEGLLTKRFKLKSKLKELDKGSTEYTLLKSRTDALKLVVNSFYGYLGFFGSRWYCLECAKAVTAWGREYIKETMSLAEEKSFDVVYGDTDSLMICFDEEDFKSELHNFVEEVNSELPGMMELELEGVFKRGIFITKKRYAMADMEGSIVVKGLERVRRDWAPIARKTQEKLLKALLDEGDVDKAEKVVYEAINRLKNREAELEEVAIFTQLTRDLDEYEQMAPHVKVAKRMKRAGKKVRMGTIVEYIITPGHGSVSDRARPVNESQNYDPKYYIEHQVVPACQRILDALDIEINHKGQVKLDEFM